MKKWWLGLVALLTMVTFTVGVPAQASAPKTPKTIKVKGKYGTYRRYTKKLPKSLRGKWYAKISKKHHYYDQLNFKSYKTIMEKRQNNSIDFSMYNRIGKEQYGQKLFYNKHWFILEGIAFTGVFRVKKMTIEHKRQSVLMYDDQGQTTYYLRHKSKHMHTFLGRPQDFKLMGHI
ncbi:hypothetical protein D1831_09705 [Lactiplantibacillus garii]|uniref:Extracellular protein n=1 Tax=Lactiplantibacillus garii TaxID=2306423 RepID=A0A3R8KKT3_9LACO|nr:hypothetical protein [Lactiplantibacillus garii]RRK10022.1 hypothetical protein D1831_09705 [Lactiplantibacillus garii]